MVGPETWLKIFIEMLFTYQNIKWWTWVMWIIAMFLSVVWTLILMAPIHCKGFIGEQLYYI